MNLNESSVLQHNDIPHYQNHRGCVTAFQIGELPSSQYEKTFVKVDTEVGGHRKENQRHTQAWDCVTLFFQY